MGHTVQVEVPIDLWVRAKAYAERKRRDPGSVLVDWMRNGAPESPIEEMSDEEVLALADMMMDEGQQEEMSDLLAQQREREITDEGRVRLDELLDLYRHGTLRKAEALHVAVQRGLRPPSTVLNGTSQKDPC
jgi:hypothetical protein